MQIRGIPDEDTIRRIVDQVSEVQYGGNLECYTLGRVNGTTLTMTLRVKDTSGPGARRAARPSKGGKGRRLIAACWHAHRDVMLAIFNVNPDARITTMMADYRGIDGFLRHYLDTAGHNVGSVMEPARYARLCDCPRFDDEDIEREVSRALREANLRLRQVEREIAELRKADTVAILTDLRKKKVKA